MLAIPKGHWAKAGDSFFLIAQTFGVSLDALLAANPGVNPDRLFIGQVICVPTGIFSYTIKAGDTFFILAERYNTKLNAIQRANPNVNPNNLQIGQIICIPRT